MEQEQNQRVFAECRKCTRPYKKTAKFPNEVCPVCEQAPKETQEEESNSQN